MQELNEGELKIVNALNKLDKLWKQYGKNLVLFNGDSLRKGGRDASKEVATFPNIIGDGGDGGDVFEK